MWWGAVTLTTVGYGNVYPITALGKVLGGLIAFLGIGLFALPTAILGSGFYEEVQRRKRKQHEPSTCPHCGKAIDER
jgi:voltage-gated potassium channel